MFEVDPKTSRILSPKDTLLSLKVNIKFGEINGFFHCNLPYSMIEPIKATLEEDVKKDENETDHSGLSCMRNLFEPFLRQLDQLLFVVGNFSRSLFYTKYKHIH